MKLTAPASLALRFLKDENGIAVPDSRQPAEKRIIVETQERQGEKLVWQWHVQDQGAIRQEDSLPPLSTFNPVLRITAGNWDAYAGEVLAALHGAADNQKVAQQRLAGIVANAQGTDERIAAIRDFVVKTIRGAGPGCDDLPLSAITPADRTLSDGYGNTTDRAVLLYALLKEAGLSPEFVLVNYGSSMELIKRFETQYPMSSVFGSVLVRSARRLQGRLSERYGPVRRARRHACGRLPGAAACRGTAGEHRRGAG